MKFNFKKIALVMLIVTVLACMMSVSAFAAGTGDVAGAVEDTYRAWRSASTVGIETDSVSCRCIL